MVQAVRHLLHTILVVASALASLAPSAIRSRAQLAAENLFLRRQLALYQERKSKPRRADDSTRIILVGLSRFLAWRHLLLIVKPETLIRWHRQGFRVFWRWKSRRRGRPAISPDVQRLIATMGGGQSDVGRGTHRERAPTEAGHPTVAAHGAAIHAAAPAAPEPRDASLEHIRPEPRPIGPRDLKADLVGVFDLSLSARVPCGSARAHDCGWSSMILGVINSMPFQYQMHAEELEAASGIAILLTAAIVVPVFLNRAGEVARNHDGFHLRVSLFGPASRVPRHCPSRRRSTEQASPNVVRQNPAKSVAAC
jgi:hypothetical protein